MSRAFLRAFALALLVLIGHVHAAYAMAQPCSEHEHSHDDAYAHPQGTHDHSQDKHSNHCDACTMGAAASIAHADRPLLLVTASRCRHLDPGSPPLSADSPAPYRPPIAR